MNEILLILLSLSISGSVLALLLFALRPFLKARLSQAWQYYIWLVVILRFLLPYSPEAGVVGEAARWIGNGAAAPIVTAPAGGTESPRRDQPFAEAPQSKTEPAASPAWRNIADNIWIIWFAVALAVFTYRTSAYINFTRYVRGAARVTTQTRLLELYRSECAAAKVRRKLPLRVSARAGTPMLIGIVRPLLILPALEAGDEEFRMIFRHELTHYKRLDYLYKWIVQFTICLHWFNPLIYRIARQIDKSCELSCDESVIRNTDMEGRVTYGRALMASLKAQENYGSFVISMTMSDNINSLKERLDLIMKYKKKNKTAIVAAVGLTIFMLCGAGALGAYVAGPHHQTDSNPGTDTVSLYTNSAEIIGFQQDEQASVKETAIHITEDNVKIQLNALVDGDSHRTLEVISPKGELVRTYTFNENGFISGNKEYVSGNDMIMVTDAVYPGTWYVRLSTKKTPAEKTSVIAKLIDPFIWSFQTETDTYPAELEEEEIADTSPLSAQIYDYYRTYEQTKEDIQNGYILHTGISFTEKAMPTVTGGQKTSFYVNHENTVSVSIALKNLLDGSGLNSWAPDSFVTFEVYDPSGNAAYSFSKKGKDIQESVDIDTELAVYPGEWQYQISFAYITNGTDPSNMEIALKYKTIFEDDIQWLIDNKLNQPH